MKDISPEIGDEYRYYANLYKTFIRPIMPTCKVFHHAPVNAANGVEQNPWFVMEFDFSDRSKGSWTTLVKIYPGKNDYQFVPRGLESSKNYKVTFDRLKSAVQKKLLVHLESTEDSELLLFEATSK